MNHELCNKIMKIISIKVLTKFHQLKFQFNLKDIKFKICYCRVHQEKMRISSLLARETRITTIEFVKSKIAKRRVLARI